MLSIQQTLACLILASMLISGTASARSHEQKNSEAMDWESIYIEPSDLKGHWAERLFQWAILKHIIDGYPDGTFKPNKTIAEAEFLKALYRAFGAVLPSQKHALDGSLYNWTDGPYRLAKMWNHPTLGSINPKSRLAPITRGRAAEILAAAQGVHYKGLDAIQYLVGNELVNSNIVTLEEFRANDTLTRSEAIQWIRRLTLKGMMEIKARPLELTDRSLLPKLPSYPAEMIPEFSTRLVTELDFNLFGTNSTVALKIGDSKETIDGLYGVSDDLDIFDNIMYPLFSVHYNEKGLLDSWKMDLDTIDAGESLLFTTKKGIILGESTLFDVLQQYGSAGYFGDGIANYLYEKTTDGNYRSLDAMPSHYRINNLDKTYLISFIFDKTTLKADYIMVSWLPLAYGNFE